jgi:hypothetical protein
MNNKNARALGFISRITSVAFLGVILTACGSTKLKSHWQAEGFSKTQLDKVLVIAISPNKTNRILFEDGLMRALQKQGITAESSHKVLPQSNPTKDDVVAYIKSHDIKYVMATKVDSIKTYTDYVPPSAVTYVSGPSYYWHDNSVTMTREEFTHWISLPAWPHWCPGQESTSPVSTVYLPPTASTVLW